MTFLEFTVWFIVTTDIAKTIFNMVVSDHLPWTMRFGLFLRVLTGICAVIYLYGV